MIALKVAEPHDLRLGCRVYVEQPIYLEKGLHF